ncbi:MAG: MFS transporter [Candidatus Paracaedimonas acanthamoebae]|uniref:MFS transporter n=1 Tax=Candidatus Paracaedimonas acanthamoebae TaxID=244581 RepID=A0A8J7Q034_9PROT|nr:MFS transporter [Candidatus Paracaedimonas acanthamoebae]
MQIKSNVRSSILKNKIFLSTIVGNSLDHYDTALYGFLAPYMAPLFFPNDDPVVALIYAYSLLSVSIVTRPLGALFFGKLSGEKGGKQAFIFSLWGVALTTGGIGILPSFEKIGVFAPLALVLLRVAQGFFAAGESTVAPLLMLKNVPSIIQGQANGIYQSSTVAGILLASFAATLVSFSNFADLYWRIPFLLSFFTGILGLYLRYQIKQEMFAVKPNSPSSLKIVETLIRRKKDLFRIIAVSSLSYVTYAIPFVFMNIFVTQVTSLTFGDALKFNTILLALDMCLLPLFGKFSDIFGVRRTMIFIALLLAITAIPFFALIPYSNMFGVGLIRLWIVLCGLGFSASLQAWFIQSFKGRETYLLTGVGYALGSELFGRSAPALCLWFWHLTNWVIAPAFYIVVISIAAILALRVQPLKNNLTE